MLCSIPAMIFKRIVDVVKDVSNETCLDFNGDGLCFQVMDAAHTSISFVKLDSKDFTLYKCKRPCTAGVNLAHLSKALRFAKGDENLVIKLDENDTNIMKLKIESEDRNCNFDIGLYTVDIDRLQLPPTSDYVLKSKFDSHEFLELVKDLAIIGEDLTLMLHDKKCISFETSGDIGKVVIKYDDVTIDQKNYEEHSKNTYGLRYLNTIAKASSLDDKVEVRYRLGMPLCLIYRLFQDSKITFFVAPKCCDQYD